MNKQILLTLAITITAPGQTHIDLRTQSKGVDFQSAPYTKPLKSGAILPATCAQGELFFLLTASPGSNIAMCSSTNTWTFQAASFSVENDGTMVGSRDVLNLVPGFGVSTLSLDTGAQINIQQAADSAVLLTTSNHQSGQALLCASATGSATTYGCSLTPTLVAYRTGMILNWVPDMNGAGGATTLNIDTLGAKSIKLADGTTNPLAADVVNGRLLPLWYDGANFRIIAPATPTVSSNPPPPCDVNGRGRLWHYAAGSGSKDQVNVCAKDGSDAYAWRPLY